MRQKFFFTISRLLARIGLMIFSLRYRLTIRGFENLSSDRLDLKKGTLFLANHPSNVEALLFAFLLWPRFQIHPVAVEYVYRLSVLAPLMKWMKAIPIPDFNVSVNRYKVKKAKEAVDSVANLLQEGGNVFIFPAGNKKNKGKEVIGGASATHELISRFPEVNIVLARVTGLWGSSLSSALTGKSPDILQTVKKGIFSLLKNFIFFAPRRPVIIEFESNPSDFPRRASRLECNRYLENWYNRYPDKNGGRVESEPLTLIPYQFWNGEVPQPLVANRRSLVTGGMVSEKTRQKIFGEIRHILDNPTLQVTDEMSLTLDLGMDSLNIADLAAFLLKNYSLEENFHLEDLATVKDAIEMAEGAQLEIPSEEASKEWNWPEEKNRPEPINPMEKTTPEAFLHICRIMKDHTACADEMSGILSYKKMKRAILVLADHFKKIPEEQVAILLPASAGAMILILALQFAKKVPVMLNWTLGPRYLENMMEISGAKKVLSSWRFIDRVSQVDFGALDNQLIFLEDIRSEISLGRKVIGALLTHLPDSIVSKYFHLSTIDEESLSGILFTSGTEAMPKGVPLSYKNILENGRASFHLRGEWRSSDIGYTVLPPFHSFGFNCTGVLAILSGLKTIFYPDPTNHSQIARGIARSKATLFPAPPSFIKRLLNTAGKEQLKTLRLFIAGAEKTPEEVLQKARSLGIEFIDGYGITECSPAVAVSPLFSKEISRKKLLPGFEVITLHPESQELLPFGADGEICLRGPSVFKGYLGNTRSPFIEIENKSWYRTGDLGFTDREGNLYLSGRLKRFMKVGGEMISLGAIEETLTQELIATGEMNLDTQSLAICVKEGPLGKEDLILFAVISLDKEKVNDILRKSGFSNLVKVSDVRKIYEIPLLATGKIDYRRLQKLS